MRLIISEGDMTIDSTDNLFLRLNQLGLDPGQRRIPLHTRIAVLRRDRHVCRYCGARATEVDHVEPWSRGGPTVSFNLVAACQRCNRLKGDKTPEEWQRTQALERLLAKIECRRTGRGRIEVGVRGARSRTPLIWLDNLSAERQAS